MEALRAGRAPHSFGRPPFSSHLFSFPSFSLSFSFFSSFFFFLPSKKTPPPFNLLRDKEIQAVKLYLLEDRRESTFLVFFFFFFFFLFFFWSFQWCGPRFFVLPNWKNTFDLETFIYILCSHCIIIDSLPTWPNLINYDDELALFFLFFSFFSIDRWTCQKHFGRRLLLKQLLLR